MKILLVEAFYSGSHKKWADEYQKYSKHDVNILSLEGRHWKWRMHGAAISLANKFKKLNDSFDLILATDMIDFACFLSLIRQHTSKQVKTAIYFHENQLTYPWSPKDQDVKLKRDNHYAFINFTSALAAEKIFFNSQYHKDSFLRSLRPFLSQFPDHKPFESIDEIVSKSSVLPLGMNLAPFKKKDINLQRELPVLLWNHRWEYDKAPDDFFNCLFRLKEDGIPFKLIVLGESYKNKPAIFDKAQSVLSDEIIHFGYAKDHTTYKNLLGLSDILPVTSIQDFFGGSIVEAMASNCYPILPNRLAYPEHIPSHLWKEHLYDNPNQFYNLLKDSIYNIDKIRSTNISEFVDRYDWSILAPHYDKVFSEFCKL